MIVGKAGSRMTWGQARWWAGLLQQVHIVTNDLQPFVAHDLRHVRPSLSSCSRRVCAGIIL